MFPASNKAPANLEDFLDSITQLYVALSDNSLQFAKTGEKLKEIANNQKGGEEKLRQELASYQCNVNDLNSKLISTSKILRKRFLSGICSQESLLATICRNITNIQFDHKHLDLNYHTIVSDLFNLAKDFQTSKGNVQDIKYYQSVLLTKYLPSFLFALAETSPDNSKTFTTEILNSITVQLLQLAYRSYHLTDRDLALLLINTYNKYNNNEPVRTIVKLQINKIITKRLIYHNIFFTQLLPALLQLREDILDLQLQMTQTKSVAVLNELKQLLVWVNVITTRDYKLIFLPNSYIPGYNDIYSTLKLCIKGLSSSVVNDKIKITLLSIIRKLNELSNDELQVMHKLGTITNIENPRTTSTVTSTTSIPSLAQSSSAVSSYQTSSECKEIIPISTQPIKHHQVILPPANPLSKTNLPSIKRYSESTSPLFFPVISSNQSSSSLTVGKEFFIGNISSQNTTCYTTEQTESKQSNSLPPLNQQQSVGTVFPNSESKLLPKHSLNTISSRKNRFMNSHKSPPAVTRSPISAGHHRSESFHENATNSSSTASFSFLHPTNCVTEKEISVIYASDK